MDLEQWFLTFLALLPLELANKAVITPPFLMANMKKENHERKQNHILLS